MAILALVSPNKLGKGLGHIRENIINLFQFIDWMLTLPSELEKDFWQEFREYEEARTMRYVTSVERIGIEQGIQQGLIKGISLGLKLKFGESGQSLLPEIESIGDVNLLSAILEAIETANTTEELRQIYQSANE
ncbi:MAG: hypothetical protein ACSI46_08925 [Gloeotrichia echinulata DVL01]|jgi:hypothetical protein